MNSKKNILFLTLILIASSIAVFAQKTEKKDKAIYTDKKAGYYQNVLLKTIESEDQKNTAIKETEKVFSMDFTGNIYPTDTSKYTKFWHNNPLNQGLTGTCWCFAGTSFVESEAERTTKRKIKLSEMFTVYWEYVERAKYFVEKRGNMYFSEGSESNAVLRMMKKYGAVPSYAYTGKLPGKTVHNHTKMVQEMTAYLASVKEYNQWNEETVVATIKNILNYYMGEPPTAFTYEGKTLTPANFYSDVLQFNAGNYFSFMSTKEIAYNQKGLLDEPDNWWKCNDYYNLALNDYMKLVVKALTKGYTIALCGDVSEPGYNSQTQVGVIPSFDIPSEYIDEDARQYRMENKSTTDDHCIHIVGYQLKDGKYWFLIKDSGSGANDGNTKGYRFYHEDYIKLKMLNLLMHKDAAKEFLDKIIK
ncbi:MAG: peptidase C1 [Bacteroidetes bacterium]|nr:peptidase C1 [Bacteroidota bacterium]